jgi:hypothetical protein
MISIIHFCECMLNRPQTPTERLATLSLEDQTPLANDLQVLLLNQR